MLRRHFVQSSMLLVGCGGAVHESTASSGAVHSSTPRPSAFDDTIGLTTRAAIEAHHEHWRSADSAPARATSEALASVPPGAEVDVFLGTWCGDSRQQITRLFVALEIAESLHPLPFSLRYIAVDRIKHAFDAETQRELTEGQDIRFVPTIIVRRQAREGRGGEPRVEVGRIVEHPTRSIEEDLLDLLRGTRTGFLSLTRTP